MQQLAFSLRGAKPDAIFGRRGVQLPAERTGQRISGMQATGCGNALQWLIRRLQSIARHLHAHGLDVCSGYGAQLGLEQARQLSFADVDTLSQEWQRKRLSEVLRDVLM